MSITLVKRSSVRSPPIISASLVRTTSLSQRHWRAVEQGDVRRGHCRKPEIAGPDQSLRRRQRAVVGRQLVVQRAEPRVEKTVLEQLSVSRVVHVVALDRRFVRPADAAEAAGQYAISVRSVRIRCLTSVTGLFSAVCFASPTDWRRGETWHTLFSTDFSFAPIVEFSSGRPFNILAPSATRMAISRALTSGRPFVPTVRFARPASTQTVRLAFFRRTAISAATWASRTLTSRSTLRLIAQHSVRRTRQSRPDRRRLQPLQPL